MSLLSSILTRTVRLLTGAHAHWHGCLPLPRQRIYFANHTSHLDTLAIWAALPRSQRKRTHAVAAQDYWGRNPFKRWIATTAFNAIFVERQGENQDGDPLEPLYAALEKGDSLILFPEGTRSAQSVPSAFKSGIYNLAVRCPWVELVPVYLEDLHKVMPKGAYLPSPNYCRVRFGAPLLIQPEESRDAFLIRTRNALIALSPSAVGEGHPPANQGS